MYSDLNVDEISADLVIVSGRSICSGKKYTLELPAIGWNLYITGSYIQDAFPNLSADDREFLISGIGPGEFELFCGDEED
jgi:hypothetical protein